jgi:hypothetical protein
MTDDSNRFMNNFIVFDLSWINSVVDLISEGSNIVRATIFQPV